MMNLYEEVLNYIENNADNAQKIEGTWFLGELTTTLWDVTLEVTLAEADGNLSRTVYISPQIYVPKYKNGLPTNDIQDIIDLNNNWEYNFYEIQEWNKQILNKVRFRIEDVSCTDKNTTSLNSYLTFYGYSQEEVRKELYTRFDIEYN